ncbi:outer membrane protein [Orrella daihaiensis]|uniref:OmpW family protein n=1 Tax=Orrella daihaiensis TaxID=2782176 RepID=A0ABY4API0_9BURK|nr:hypothetical protein [Orrella daihaiensis]UOD50965.1 hypothetical protein DHf2319_03340 [Orrella daihaiensis]
MLLRAPLCGLALLAGNVFASEAGLGASSDKGFTGLSLYTATGYQHTTIKGENLRVQGTNITLPSRTEKTNGSFWLVGLDYTHVFANRMSLGAQFDYYPKSGQYALSISPGYQFNETVLGYLRFGWANVPTTVEQGVGQPSYKTWLNAYFAGIGAKVNITRGLFAYAELRYSEVDRLNFTSTADVTVAPGVVRSVPIEGSADTSAINAFIGLGYRF